MKTVNKILMMLVAAYPRQALADETITLYERMLQDIPPAILELSVMRLITRSVFFPTVAEIRGAAADIGMEQRGVPTALQAWDIALHQPGQASEEIKQIVRAVCGDFYNLRMSTMQAADRARFLEAYGELLAKERTAVTDTPELRAGQYYAAGLLASDNGHPANAVQELANSMHV